MAIEAPRNLSAKAQDLLATLQGEAGRDTAVPSNYPGKGAFSDFAYIYFFNAATLCEHPRGHDAAVFGALYFLRHGLELWLKAMIQNRVISKVVEAIGDGEGYDAVIAKAQEGTDGSEKKYRREQLITALCALRNVERGVYAPDNFEQDIGEEYAREFVAGPTSLRREHLALVWPVPVFGHDLSKLWEESKPLVDENCYYAQGHAERDELTKPMTLDEIEVICELLGGLDPTGDGFRYPASLHGRWYMDLPSVNLRILGSLAEKLMCTVQAFTEEF